ncbi:hypothetical protein CN187_33045 [Sinorhizobium meliloti]|uniref:MucR family transcriptional regulator n=1 Tax=Rhizobium meliloti TaxID=382 RepID=UPI000FD7A723|nr:MucR family transcriptional regulator [Sinorhizobium meliloti]RVI58799.1 hypothetical protein CN187_33045 [Sinorhizobium meliloti]
MTESRSNELRLELTSRIVSAYLSRNVIAPSELPHLIQLPPDYPMVAPNYSRNRSELARATGLGEKSAAKLSPSLQAVTSA